MLRLDENVRAPVVFVNERGTHDRLLHSTCDCLVLRAARPWCLTEELAPVTLRLHGLHRIEAGDQASEPLWRV